jgi:two-component sensor histidine kinase
MNQPRGAIQEPARPTPALDGSFAVREANQRIGSNLTLIAGLIHMQSRALRESLTPEQARSMLGEVAARIDAIAHLHRLMSTSDAPDVDISEHLRSVCDAVVGSLGSDDFTLTYDLQTCRARADQAGAIALIVNELVTNAIKYSHPTGVAGVITIKCRQTVDTLALEVSDDGVGLPENFDPETGGGMGLEMVRTLRTQLNAKIEFDHDCLGLRVRLSVPVSIETVERGQSPTARY